MNTYKAYKLRIFPYALQVCAYNLDDAFQKFLKEMVIKMLAGKYE